MVRYADFTDEFASGESLAAIGSITVSVWSGNDPSPAIIGPFSIVPNTAGIPAVAQVQVQAGVLGTIYQCMVNGVTSASRVITKTAMLAVKPPMN